MIYNNFQNLKLSSLGLGCMRLPLKEDGEIDQVQVDAMVDYSLENGINYFDTAWGYHNGKSELAVGESLKRHPRESFYLASKFPGYDVSNIGKNAEIFEKQLEKCQVEYFDFYLVHNVNEKNIDPYLDDAKFGTVTYLLKQKELGRIKHLGFSCHGSLETMQRFLDAYGEHMEFAQIQLNYLDYKFQDAKAKVELLNKYNIPIWVMEPLRGGKIAEKLSDDFVEKFKTVREDANIIELAFRFLQTIPGVTVTLSGMSNMDQLKENVKIYEENKPLNEEEMGNMLKIADEIVSRTAVPCTACRYCTEKCPIGLDIPELISLYNEESFTGGGFLAPMKLSTMPQEKRPAACVGCGMCATVCPQEINIPEVMSNFANKMDGHPMLK